jgi:hypothetical protein
MSMGKVFHTITWKSSESLCLLCARLMVSCGPLHAFSQSLHIVQPPFVALVYQCISSYSVKEIICKAIMSPKHKMKWQRYQRVISLETGITSQRNKWTNRLGTLPLKRELLAKARTSLYRESKYIPYNKENHRWSTSFCISREIKKKCRNILSYY